MFGCTESQLWREDLWSLLQLAGPSFLMRDQTWAPALGSGILATGLPGKSPGPLYYWLDPHFLYDHVWLVPFKPLFLFGQKSILFPLYHTGHIHKKLSSHLRIKTEHTHTRTVRHSALRCVCSSQASRLLFSTDLKSLCENLLYMNLWSEAPEMLSARGYAAGKQQSLDLNWSAINPPKLRSFRYNGHILPHYGPRI